MISRRKKAKMALLQLQLSRLPGGKNLHLYWDPAREPVAENKLKGLD